METSARINYTMGTKHSTNIHNNHGKEISVVVTCPDGHNTQISMKQGEVHNVSTAPGIVLISVYYPGAVGSEYPIARRGVPSNIRVMIASSDLGNPTIVRIAFGSIWTPDPDNNE
ncbi:hypothetical protein FKM82_018934 [Ascaphus truei]